MGLFSKNRNELKSETNALGWLAFAIALLGWVLDALKKFPPLPTKPEENAGTNP